MTLQLKTTASMMIPSPVVLLTLLSVASFAAGEIRHYEIRSDDRPILLLDLFGFSNRGQLELNLTVLSRRPLRPDSDILSKMGFFLCTHEECLKVLQQFEDSEITCELKSSPYVVYTFESLPTPITTKFDFLYTESKAGLYTLLFVNCNLGLRVSMNLRSAMYNLEAGESDRRDYLSANETALPGVYLMFAVIYLAMASIWFSTVSEKMILNRSGIHFLMLLVVVLKALNFLCDAKYKSDIKSTGYYAHGWFYVLFYVFSFLKDITFFPVIILIGSGWPFLKPDLQGKMKKVLMIVIPLQLVANTAQLMIHKKEPYFADWIVWNQVWLLTDTVCWFAVLFPIFWTIKNLRWALRTASSDAKAELNSRKGSLFRQYCVVVICYISFTKVVVPVLKGVTSYEYVESIAAPAVSREFATMAFCVFTGYMVQAWYQDSA